MQVKNSVDPMRGTKFNDSVEMFEPFVVQFEGIELLRVVEKVAVIEGDAKGIQAVVV